MSSWSCDLEYSHTKNRAINRFVREHLSRFWLNYYYYFHFHQRSKRQSFSVSSRGISEFSSHWMWRCRFLFSATCVLISLLVSSSCKVSVWGVQERTLKVACLWHGEQLSSIRPVILEQSHTEHRHRVTQPIRAQPMSSVTRRHQQLVVLSAQQFHLSLHISEIH